MAITQTYLSMDEYFRFTTGDKLIINHLAYLDSKDMDTIKKKLTTVYEGDIISTLPVCDCGVTKGRYLLNRECPECGSICKDPKDKTTPILWFEALAEDLKFINPAFWNSITTMLSKRTDLLRWLSDPRYVSNVTVPNYIILAKNEILHGQRDYRMLVNNFGPLLDYFITSTEVKAKSWYNELKTLRDIFYQRQDELLSTYLPVLNKKLFVIENTTKGTYTSLVLGDILDVITIWLKASPDTVSPRQKSITTGMVVGKLSALYIKYYKAYLLGKPGSLRKHCYGARSHFTFRSVITASTGVHRHNEIIPPWVISLSTYRPHILNKLIRKGYSYLEADNIMSKSIFAFHPDIKAAQDELIAESPYPQGLPVLCNRNPSLLQGATQMMFIPYFNSNPKVLTTTLSPLAAKAPNADFDGDELNYYPLMDHMMVDEFKTLRPFFNIPDMTKPCSVSGKLSLDTPNNSILASYLNDKTVGQGDDTLLQEL